MTAQTASTAKYIIVFAVLLILTALTVGAAFINMGRFNDVAAMFIAGCKAGLVTAIFMHVRTESKLVKATITAGCLWVFLLIALTMSDFLTRTW